MRIVTHSLRSKGDEKEFRIRRVPGNQSSEGSNKGSFVENTFGSWAITETLGDFLRV